MALEYFRMLIHELLNKYPDIVPDEYSLVILDSKSSECMAKNGKDVNYASHISIRTNFVINGDKCKMHDIYWCEGGLQFSDIATNNVGENYLDPRMKYIMVILDNW